MGGRKLKEYYNLKPLIKSLGGKSWFCQEAWKYYKNACKNRDSDMRWVDPFCGGLAIPLYIMPNEAWLNDANVHLINFYNHIADNGKIKNFIDEIAESDYYKKREQFNKNIKDDNVLGAEMAELFYYLNKTCYGGVSRYNNSGLFNAPYGKNIKPSFKTDFKFEQQAFQGWQITAFNYSDVLSMVDDNDFLFIDPPYDETFNKYIKRDFNWDDQVKLATMLSRLPNPIIATNSTSDRIVELYSSLGFEMRYAIRRNNLQQARVEKLRGEKYKEAVFYKNIEVTDHE